MLKRSARIISVIMILALFFTIGANADYSAEEKNSIARSCYQSFMDSSSRYHFYCCMDLNGDGIDELLVSETGMDVTVCTMDSVYLRSIKLSPSLFTRYMDIAYDPDTRSLVGAGGGTGLLEIRFLSLDRKGNFSLTLYSREIKDFSEEKNAYITECTKIETTASGTSKSSFSLSKFDSIDAKRSSFDVVYFHNYTGTIPEKEVLPAKAVADEFDSAAQCSLKGYFSSADPENPVTEEKKQFNNRLSQERKNTKFFVADCDGNGSCEMFYIVNNGLDSCIAGFSSFDASGRKACSVSDEFPIPGAEDSLVIVTGKYDGSPCVAFVNTAPSGKDYRVYSPADGKLLAEYHGSADTEELNAFKSRIEISDTCFYGREDGCSIFPFGDNRYVPTSETGNGSNVEFPFTGAYRILRDYLEEYIAVQTGA